MTQWTDTNPGAGDMNGLIALGTWLSDTESAMTSSWHSLTASLANLESSDDTDASGAWLLRADTLSSAISTQVSDLSKVASDITTYVNQILDIQRRANPHKTTLTTDPNNATAKSSLKDLGSERRGYDRSLIATLDNSRADFGWTYGTARLMLTMPLGSDASPAWANDFAAWASSMPDTPAGRAALRESMGWLTDEQYTTLRESHPLCLSLLLKEDNPPDDPTYRGLYDAYSRTPKPTNTYNDEAAQDIQENVGEVAAAWAALTPHQRRVAARAYPWLVGNADGIPTVFRDTANRTVLEVTLAQLESDDQPRVTIPGGDPGFYYYPDLTRDQRRARKNTLQEVHNQLTYNIDGEGHPYPDKGEVPRYLIVLDTDITGSGQFDRTGRVAISFGNPDTADHVGVVVPGMNTFPSDVGDHDLQNLVTKAGAIHRQSTSLQGIGTVATVAWLDYDPPGLSQQVANANKANQGAYELSSYLWGVETTHAKGSPHLTLVGHSYGSLVAGVTAKQENPIDDLVLVGSPGTSVSHVSELKVDQDSVWVALTEDKGNWRFDHDGDWEVDSVAERFGGQPAREKWGATRFDTNGGVAPMHPKGTATRSKGHSEYFKSGSESLDNISAIVAGRSDLVSLHEQSQP